MTANLPPYRIKSVPTLGSMARLLPSPSAASCSPCCRSMHLVMCFSSKLSTVFCFRWAHWTNSFRVPVFLCQRSVFLVDGMPPTSQKQYMWHGACKKAGPQCMGVGIVQTRIETHNSCLLLWQHCIWHCNKAVMLQAMLLSMA